MVQRAHAMPDKCAQIVRLDVLLHYMQRDRFAVGAFHDECKAACSAGLLMALGVSGLFHDARDVPQVYRVGRCGDEPECYDDKQSPAAKKNEGVRTGSVRERELMVTLRWCLASMRAGFAKSGAGISYQRQDFTYVTRAIFTKSYADGHETATALPRRPISFSSASGID